MGFINNLREYKFGDFTKAVAKEQIDALNDPAKTWQNKWGNMCWYNGKAILSVGADVASYLFVSSLRSIGLCHPLPPKPPEFPIPHDGTELLQNAIERALWDWDPTLRKELELGIEESFSDTWNIYQVLVEWALAYCFEHADFAKNEAKDKPYMPKFLTCSEPLASGKTFGMIGSDFGKLSKKEQALVVKALYAQAKEMPKLSDAGKKVYQDMRAFASLQTQGNQNYFEVMADYQKQKEAGSLRNLQSAMTEADKVQQVFQAVVPTASVPAMPIALQPVQEIAFMKKAISDAWNCQNREMIAGAIANDRSDPLAQGNHPETLMACMPEASWKFFVARLCLLQTFQLGFRYNQFANCPTFIPINQYLNNGKNFRDVGLGFASVSESDFKRMGQAIMEPTAVTLTGPLREKLVELSEFADLLQRNAGFLQAYQELQRTIN